MLLFPQYNFYKMNIKIFVKFKNNFNEKPSGAKYNL